MGCLRSNGHMRGFEIRWDKVWWGFMRSDGLHRLSEVRWVAWAVWDLTGLIGFMGLDEIRWVVWATWAIWAVWDLTGLCGRFAPGRPQGARLLYERNYIMEIFNEIKFTSLNIAPVLPLWFFFMTSQISDRVWWISWAVWDWWALMRSDEFDRLHEVWWDQMSSMGYTCCLRSDRLMRALRARATAGSPLIIWANLHHKNI